ncbi:MAG TPA: response regulator transcription factor [Bryobacteraceae bacterium]|nr:response regulator transcription factor [Bryobacteraceae bacterium]
MTRILLNSDHTILTAGLRAVLEAGNEFSMASWPSIENVAERAVTEEAGVILLDMTQATSLETITRLCRDAPVPVVLWIDDAATEFISQALSSGVLGLVRKRASQSMLTECLREVAQHRLWVENDLSRQLLSTRNVKLTRRERQLASLLAQGLKNKEIAYRLGITEGTVKVYLSRLYGKLGVNDRFDLALFALKNLGPSQSAVSEKLSAAAAMAPLPMPSTFSVGSVQVQ